MRADGRKDRGLKRVKVVWKSYCGNKSKKIVLKKSESYKSKYQELRIGLL